MSGFVGQRRPDARAIAYAELRCGDKSGLSVARIRNAAGEFVKPSMKSIGAAAQAMDSKMTNDFRASLTNPQARRAIRLRASPGFTCRRIRKTRCAAMRSRNI